MGRMLVSIWTQQMLITCRHSRLQKRNFRYWRPYNRPLQSGCFVRFDEKVCKRTSCSHTIGNKLKKTNKKIREQLSLYNAVGGEVVKMPTHLAFDDVKSFDGNLWDILKSLDVSARRTS